MRTDETAFPRQGLLRNQACLCVVTLIAVLSACDNASTDAGYPDAQRLDGGPPRDGAGMDGASLDGTTPLDAGTRAPVDRTAGGIIPIERTVDWTIAGVPGGIPERTACIVDVTLAPYNADASGQTDASPAIQQALVDAEDGCVVYLPGGTYRIDSTLTIGFLGGNPRKSNITLRGAGMGATYLDCRANRCIEVGSEADYRWNNPGPDGAPITNGLTRGSNTLTVADASGFEPGQLVQIAVENDPDLPVVSVSGYARLRTQKSRVVSTTATTITIDPPVYGDFSTLGGVIAHASYQSDSVGIEDLSIDGSNGTVQFGIMITETYGAWIRNVHVRRASNYSVYVTDSLHCEIRHSYLDVLQGEGSNHAGLLFAGSGACLVEDNIIVESFPGIEVNFGATGNVFAYNYIRGPNVSGIMGAAIDTNHGPHNAFNLYEGNVAQMFQSDGYFGSDSDETAFRNWFHATNDETSENGRCFYINRFSRNFSLVGNVLGQTGLTYLYENGESGVGYSDRVIYALGLPNIGNGGFNGSFAPPWADWGTNPGPGGFQELDRDVAATTIRRGNWNAVDNGIRASEAIDDGATLPPSLYRAARPAWFGNLAWPAFDPVNPNLAADAIPAGYRFLHDAEAP